MPSFLHVLVLLASSLFLLNIIRKATGIIWNLLFIRKKIELLCVGEGSIKPIILFEVGGGCNRIFSPWHVLNGK